MTHQEQQLLNWCYNEIRQLTARLTAAEQEIQKLKEQNVTSN